jgi:preprotein translocase subunit SecG
MEIALAVLAAVVILAILVVVLLRRRRSGEVIGTDRPGSRP